MVFCVLLENEVNMSKHYIDYNPSEGYPIKHDYFYECLRCGDCIPAMPSTNIYCKCRNIMIDVDYGRISIQEHFQVKLYSLTPWWKFW